MCKAVVVVVVVVVVAVVVAGCATAGLNGDDDGGDLSAGAQLDGRAIYVAPVSDQTPQMPFGGVVWRETQTRLYMVAPRRSLVLFADGGLALDVVITDAVDVPVADGSAVRDKYDLCLRATASLLQRDGHVVLQFMDQACARYEADHADVTRHEARRRRAGELAAETLAGHIVARVLRVG